MGNKCTPRIRVAVGLVLVVLVGCSSGARKTEVSAGRGPDQAGDSRDLPEGSASRGFLGTRRGEHILGSDRSGRNQWVSVAFRRDGKDWVELRFADKSSSTTGDFGLTKAGRLPAEFGVTVKSGDLFIFGAVGSDIQQLTATSQQGAQVTVEPIAPNVAGTDVPVFFAHIPAATQVTAIEAKRTDGTVIALDPGPGGVEPSAVSVPPAAPPSSASRER